MASESMGGYTVITISLPLPPRELSPNYTVGSRGGRLGKAAKIKKYRQHAGLVTMAAMGRQPRRYTTATAQATFYVKDRRRRDADNALASLKAAFDGMRDAGLIEDDSGLTHLPVVFAVDKARPRVEIRVQAGQKEQGGEV